MADGDLDSTVQRKQSGDTVSSASSSVQSSGNSSEVQFSGNNSSEEPLTEIITATARVKNQKTSHWFLWYKFVK
jgi:hypothetical protein